MCIVCVILFFVILDVERRIRGQKKKKKSRMAVLPVVPVGNCVVVAICAAKTK